MPMIVERRLDSAVQVPVYASNSDAIKGSNAVGKERTLCKGAWAPGGRPAGPQARWTLALPLRRRGAGLPPSHSLQLPARSILRTHRHAPSAACCARRGLTP